MVRSWSLLSAAILVCLPCVASADQDDSIIKWSQLPDVTRLGFDYSSEWYLPGTQLLYSSVADDFVCNDPRPITDIHWWGSYWTAPYATPSSNYWLDPSCTDVGVVMPNTVLGFNFVIYDHVPIADDPGSTTMPYGHPGNVLYSTYMSIADVAINLHAVIDRTGDGIIGNVGDEAVWQYYVDLTDPFPQVVGTTYWLSIQAVVDGSQVQWGWHTAEELTGNNAVQAGPSELWGLMYERPWVLMVDKDMAFELSVGKIPEPFTAGLLGLGFGGLMVARRRRKH